ncbi:MAG: hypothetical protein Kow0013_18950 [Pararhodobacter sp.]
MPFRPAFAPALMLGALLAAPGFADPIDAETAGAALFRPDRVEVVRYDMSGLSEDDVNMLTTLAQTQRYYAALAYAPDAGIMAEPTVLSANFHSVEAARGAALQGCNARRSGGAACRIAIEVRPQGWEARDFQMSADATQAFNEQYRRARGPRAMAISASSGQWGIGRGDAASEDALAACRGEAGVSDCAVVIQD